MNKYKLIVALDIGKSTTKAIGRLYKDGKIVKNTNKLEEARISIVTKCEEVFEEDIDVEHGSFLVEHNNTKYLVGDMASIESTGSSKLNYIHELCGITALTKYMEKDSVCEVYMTLASPLNQLMNKEYITAYKSYFMKENGESISVTVNKENFEFIVKDIVVKPEGSGLLITDIVEFKDKEVALMDIGGMNLGFSLYINGKANKASRFIEEIGNKRLEELISTAIMVNSGPDKPSQSQVTKAIRKGYLTLHGKVDEASKVYISQAKQKFFAEVIRALKKHNIDPTRVDTLLFIGGTSQNLEAQIRLIPNAIHIDDSQWKAVVGLYKLALHKFKEAI